MVNTKLLAILLVIVNTVSSIETKFSISKYYVEDRDGSTTISLGRLNIFEEG